MANGGSTAGGSDVFDVRKVRRLVELMKEYELAEVDLQQGDHRIRLKRGGEPVITAAAPAAVAPPVAAAPPKAAPAATPTASPGSASAANDADTTFITSPMVGTFYKSSSPDSPAFVNVGDRVNADTTVCILEAMKVFNEIPADCSGTIVSCLAENGDAIEFGQKLFEIKAS
ncbi:MAG: acetyl-CoA carboxylase biotin carboxyl carrier protein [Planctomycetota bacterium]